MKNRSRAFLLPVAGMLLSSGLLADPLPEIVWQIGVQDGKETEFALYGKPYDTVKDHFPGLTALYTVGQSDASDIPYVIPGPSDSWANNPMGCILVHFGTQDDAGAERLRLVMDFVEVHSSSAPRMQVCLNGISTEVQVPTGLNQNYLDDHKTSSKGLSVSVDIPSHALRKGDNTLMIRSISGSWAVLDDIRLESSEPVALCRPGGGISLMAANSVPALVYGDTKDEILHPVTLQIVNWDRKSRSADWFYDGDKKGGRVLLAPGLNSIEAGIPEGYEGKTVDFAVKSGRGLQSASVEIRPAYEWTIYLVQHTHTDIGYTKSQTEILTEHLRYIDYAIEYCEATENYPDDSRFRWTCEASWAVREWLRIRPEEQVKKFLHFVGNGQIEVTAMFFNMSELSGENNYKTFLEPVARFHELGIPVMTAMQNDVNGVAWCLADYLPDIGVKYITMGSNGHRADIPFDRPMLYKWESPSGKSLLSFRADHYNTGNFWGIDRGDMDSVENGVFSYIGSLLSSGYEFPLIAVQYSGYFTDNSPPSRKECDLIREWNDRYVWPKLRSATAHEFLQKIDEEYSAGLPVYRAAYPDWWTDGFGSAARETAASRKTQSDMITVEGMLSMAALEGDDYVSSTRDELRRIHENLLFYDEHTFGAAESIRDPHCENSQVQWAEKGSYVWEALKSTQMMYETAIGRLQGNLYRSSRPVITFFNPAGWTRSALATVYIDFEIIPQDRAFRITDEDGKELDVQPLRSRREGRYYAIWAENIPALGYKTYEIILEDGNAPVPAAPDFKDNIMENTWYRITFDTKKGGIASLTDRSSGKELVDTSSPWSLGGFIYESLEGDRHQMERKVFEKYSRHGLENVRFTGTAAGEVYNSVFYEGTSRGCDLEHGIRVEVKLFNHVKRIEISYSMKRLPETDPSGIYVAFPFSMQESQLAFDVPGGVVNAGENQIPRTATAWNTVQNFVSARNGDSQIILSCDAVPLFMMGELLNDPYRLVHRHENAHVFSWVMNNYWTTNFRASQEGELNWTYAITTADGSSNSDASRFGWGNRIPVYARVIPASATANSNARSVSFLNHDVENVLMTSCVPSRTEPDGVLINLRETDGKEADFRLYDRSGHPVPFTVVNVLDENIGGETESVKLPPYGNIFIRVSNYPER